MNINFPLLLVRIEMHIMECIAKSSSYLRYCSINTPNYCFKFTRNSKVS